MRGGVLGLVVAVVGMVAVGGAVYVLVLLFDGTGEASGPVGVTLADLTEDGDRFAGRTVTVTERIDEVVSSRAFTLETGGGDLVVVVGERPLRALTAPRVRPGDLVRVTGRVAAGDAASADRHVRAARREQAGGADSTLAIIDAAITRSGSRLPPGPQNLEPAELERDPRPYRDELITLTATISESLAPGAWTIGEDFLVVTDLGGADRLREGDRVRLNGVVRRFRPRQLARDPGLDLPSRVRRRDDRYVLVVRGIHFIPGPGR